MQVMIDIPEKFYDMACNFPNVLDGCYAQYIRKGKIVPKGHWNVDGHHYRCSNCGKTLAIVINESDEDLVACPFCRADMI